MNADRKTTTRGLRRFVVPLVTGVIAVSFTLMLWRRLLAQERIQIDRQIRLQTEHVATLIRDDMRLRVKSLRRMANRWGYSGGTHRDHWTTDAESYIVDQPGYQALGWVDSSLHVRWIVPLKGNEKAVNLNLAFEERRKIALVSAAVSRDLMITLPIDLVQGGKGFNAYIPIYIGAEFDGFIGAVFRFQPWLDAVLDEIPVDDYSITLSIDDEVIYTHLDPAMTYADDWKQSTQIVLHNLNWRVQVVPSPAILRRLHSNLPEMTLAFGLLFTALLMLMVRLAQTAVRRSKVIERKNLDLQTEIAHRQAIEETLRQAQEHLEVQVDLRTKELVHTNQDLTEEIAERNRIEGALFDEKERLAVTLRSIGDGVITTDMNGKVVLVNRVAEALSGWSQDDAAGRPLTEIFPVYDQNTGEACESPVLQIKQGPEIFHLAAHSVLKGRDGTDIAISCSGALIRDTHDRSIGVVLVFADITQQKLMEQELQKTQKLQSIGLLAGGIAHDFNNCLTGVIGNISLAKAVLHDPDRVLEVLNRAQETSERAVGLTQQLLTFSSGGAPIKKTVSSIKLVRDAVDFSCSGSKVRCDYSVPEDLWPVDVDEGQIGQVLNNLVINADQAMPDGGTIRIVAENVELSGDRTLPLPDGKFIKISVTDHGPGIAPDNLSEIFDPFFTTKEKGNGLGLATSYSILVNHDGYITARSEWGLGATFLLYLPASKAEPEKRDNPKRADRLLTGHGRVLVMDDEKFIREVATHILTELGYDCVAVPDGVAAIEAYKEAQRSDHQFDAVILDLTVPGGMGGEVAVKHLRAFDPGLKAIVSSGYSNHPVMGNYREFGFCGVIPKPYNMVEISQMLYDTVVINTPPKLT